MISMNDFLADIESFLARTGIPPSRFGVIVCNDPNFVFDLRNGRSPNLRTLNKVQEFVNEYEGQLGRSHIGAG